MAISDDHKTEPLEGAQPAPAESEMPHPTPQDQATDASIKTAVPPPSGTTATKVAKVPQPDDTFFETAHGAWVQYFGATDVGLAREHNEDQFSITHLDGEDRWTSTSERTEPSTTKLNPKGAVFAVFDGMGGAAAGEVASALAAETLHHFFTSHSPPVYSCEKDAHLFVRILVEGIQEAGKAILQAAFNDRNQYGMGTTATVVGAYGKKLYVGQVGDSRAYLLRHGALVPLTKDQSLVNQLLEAGQLSVEEAAGFEHSNIVLQALGTSDAVFVEVTHIEIRKKDRLLVCSDGLSSLLHDDIIRDALVNYRRPEEAWEHLRSMTHSAGAHDNFTCVLVDFFGSEFDDPSGDEPATYKVYTDDIEPLSRKEDTANFKTEKSTDDRPRDDSPFSWLPPPNVGNISQVVHAYNSLKPKQGPGGPSSTDVFGPHRWLWVIAVAALAAGLIWGISRFF